MSIDAKTMLRESMCDYVWAVFKNRDRLFHFYPSAATRQALIFEKGKELIQGMKKSLAEFQQDQPEEHMLLIAALATLAAIRRIEIPHHISLRAYDMEGVFAALDAQGSYKKFISKGYSQEEISELMASRLYMERQSMQETREIKRQIFLDPLVLFAHELTQIFTSSVSALSDEQRRLLGRDNGSAER